MHHYDNKHDWNGYQTVKQPFDVLNFGAQSAVIFRIGFSFFSKKIKYIEMGHFRGADGEDNLTTKFMWPDKPKLCVKFYLLIISINTRHETNRN